LARLGLLRTVLYRRARFRLNGPRSLPSGISLRLYEAVDREACIFIYKDNEVGRFPSGFEGTFDTFLQGAEYLKIVVCHRGVPVAVGGIGLTPFLASHCAILAFGLVSPAWQRKGIGTALLLSRISLLAEPSPSTRLFMTNVRTSRAFFRRFGFASLGMVPSGRPGISLESHSTSLTPEAWRLCRERVATAGLTLPNAVLPLANLGAASPQPRTRAGRIAMLTQAALVQLSGLIWLFVVNGPIAPLGWVPIAAGFVLYIRALKQPIESR
jgi:GNAT superfamily N-acetyltransferase